MEDKIKRLRVKMNDGRTLSLFVNINSGLFVADAIDKDEKYGNEFVRMNFYNIRKGRPEIKLKKVI